MITITLKLILQIINVSLMGYLAVAFFQKLFCRDIGTIDYKRFIHDRRLIWSRFKRAFKSQKYRSFILFCFLCLLGFSLAVRDLSRDWQLNHKNMAWQIWNIFFCYAVYLSQTNMKLKLFYDLIGKTPTKTNIPMETPKNVVQMKQQMDKEITHVVNYKRAFQYMGIILVISILCCGYAFYAMKQSEENSATRIQSREQYSRKQDSIITELSSFKDSINLVVNDLKRQNDSLQIRRTAKMVDRESMLNKPIDYSNEADRKAVLAELMKEDKK